MSSMAQPVSRRSRLLALALVFSVSSTGFAQTLRESAMSAARDAAQTAPTPRGPMSPALKWTGLTLLGGGAGLIIGGIAKDNGCYESVFAGVNIIDYDCKDQAKALKILGGLVAGVGGGLLLIGTFKRDTLPSVTITPRGGVIVRHRLTF